MLGPFRSNVGPVGVDLTEGSIRLLQLVSREESWRVVGAATVRGSRAELEALEAPELVSRFRAAVGSGGFSGRRCVVALPRHEVHVHALRLPQMPEPELNAAAAWEVAERVGMPRDELEVECIRTGRNTRGAENREDVIAIASPRASILRWLEVLMEAGLRPDAVETSFTAIGRLFSRRLRRAADTNVVQMMIEFGEEGCMLMVTRGASLAFAKPLAIGGRDLTQAVVNRLKVDADAAAEIRRSRIVAASDQTSSPQGTESVGSDVDRAVFDAVRPILADLAREAMQSLRYYGVSFRGRPPRHVILTGRASAEPKLAEMVRNACKLPSIHDDDARTLTQIADDVRLRIPDDVASDRGNWAVAAGLSGRGLLGPIAVDRTTGETPGDEAAVAA